MLTYNRTTINFVETSLTTQEIKDVKEKYPQYPFYIFNIVTGLYEEITELDNLEGNRIFEMTKLLPYNEPKTTFWQQYLSYLEGVYSE